VPPYVLAVGNRARLYGLNKVGLRRKGFSAKDIDEIRHAYKIIFLSSLGIKEATERLRLDMPGSEHAEKFLEFIERSKRGITRARLKGKGVHHDEDD